LHHISTRILFENVVPEHSSRFDVYVNEAEGDHRLVRKTTLMAERKPGKHLINLLRECTVVRDGTLRYEPRYTLFLGAGASKQSGVPLANEMVAEFRRAYASIYETPLTENEWYSEETLYSDLFERLFDEPSVRREYIEDKVKFARPSWGYFYLVNLINISLFNTIFTTNFDDLLNDACHSFSEDLRPMVCAHDSSIRSIRITSTRPKIIKLHGDFLYDNIKNTVPELASLEDNTRDKFAQYSTEYGLIVTGYGGNDQSVMDSIEEGVRAKSFPHGVYWCVRTDDPISLRLRNLLRYSNVHLVNIRGFDEFMAELHDNITPMHPMIDNPYRVYGVRMLNMLNNVSVGKLDPIIQRDADLLSRSIEATEKQISFPRPLIQRSCHLEGRGCRKSENTAVAAV
jgi:hypothetical protein